MVEKWHDCLESDSLSKQDVPPQHVTVIERLGVVEGRRVTEEELKRFKLCPTPTRKDKGTTFKIVTTAKAKDPSNKKGG